MPMQNSFRIVASETFRANAGLTSLGLRPLPNSALMVYKVDLNKPTIDYRMEVVNSDQWNVLNLAGLACVGSYLRGDDTFHVYLGEVK